MLVKTWRAPTRGLFSKPSCKASVLMISPEWFVLPGSGIEDSNMLARQERKRARAFFLKPEAACAVWFPFWCTSLGFFPLLGSKPRWACGTEFAKQRNPDQGRPERKKKRNEGLGTAGSLARRLYIRTGRAPWRVSSGSTLQFWGQRVDEVSRASNGLLYSSLAAASEENDFGFSTALWL